MLYRHALTQSGARLDSAEKPEGMIIVNPATFGFVGGSFEGAMADFACVRSGLAQVRSYAQGWCNSHSAWSLWSRGFGGLYNLAATASSILPWPMAHPI
jgi:hypothetical protein